MMKRPHYMSEKWMAEQGWSEGMGLGRNLQGMTDFIKVEKKEKETSGLGKDSYDTFDFSHWDNIYNEASRTLKVTNKGDSVVMNTETSEKEKKAKASPYGNMFVKASEKNQTMTTNVKEEDLFRLCGKRELRILGQKGKEARLKAFENGTYTYVEPSRKVVLPGPDEDGDSKMRKKQRKEKKRKSDRKKEKEKKAKKKLKEKENGEKSEKSTKKRSRTEEVDTDQQKKKRKKAVALDKDKKRETDRSKTSVSQGDTENKKKKKKNRRKTKKRARTTSDESEEKRSKKRKID